MSLPEPLQAAIEAELARHAPAAVRAAAVRLSQHYARGRSSAADDELAHAAYLGIRAPATYAATLATLGMVPGHVRGRLRSVLDLGAGPGMATWAASTACAAVESAVQVDRSAALLGLGQRLASAAGLDTRLAITQHIGDIGVAPGTGKREPASGNRQPEAWPAADLVVSAYALAELSPYGRGALVASAWLATREVLALIEPGTPAGFAHLREARDVLLAAGSYMVAPCPHGHACPMLGEDWCHFAVRVPRSRRHRMLKGGSLGYEDEKYACLVLSRTPVAGITPARVLRHPYVEKGRVGLTLCTRDGARQVTVTRRDPRYHDARRATWGGRWDEAPSRGTDEDV